MYIGCGVMVKKTSLVMADLDRRSAVDAPRISLSWIPLLAIMAAAFAVEIPFFFRGTPSGHDVEFHLYSWLEVLSQWKSGIIYPRWASLAHFGYGEPRFVFYPPASWTLGATLSAIFPWVWASKIYIWLSLVAAGISMFFLARQWLDRRDATFAAVLYAVNPYHLVIVYWRSAFAELLAACLLPLLLLLLLREDGKDRRASVFLAIVLAGSWLVNAPAAVMLHYSMALLIVLIAWQRRSVRVFWVGAGAVALGAALAGFYLVPAIYEQRWINIAQAISPGARPQDNFLFVHTDDADHDAFNRVISWIVVAEIAITFAVTGMARKWRGNPGLWKLLVGWAALCAMLMLPISTLLWNILPKLRFMQFPWRWTLCLGVPFTLLVVIGVRRWTLRIALYLAAVCVLASVWQHYQPPWWDTAADLREMQDNMATGAGYEGTDEYTPAGADPAALDKDARRVTVDGPAQSAIHVLEWGAEQKRFTVELSAADQVVLHLFNYPAWRVAVNDQPVQAETRNGTGQMMIPLEAGSSRVQINFGRTWDRMAGAWLSLAAILAALLILKKPVPLGRSA